LTNILEEENEGVMNLSIKILKRILYWDFSKIDIFNPRYYSKEDEDEMKIMDIKKIIEEKWDIIYTDKKILVLLVNLHQKFSEEEDFCQTVRHCLIRISSIGSEIFSNDEDKLNYLENILSSIFFIISQ
jgi:hypothetical protein